MIKRETSKEKSIKKENLNSVDSNSDELRKAISICGTIYRSFNELKDKRETGIRRTQNKLRPFLNGSRAIEAREKCPKDKTLMKELEHFLKNGCSSQRAWAAAFISKFMEPNEAIKLLKEAVVLHEEKDMLDAKNWTLYYLGHVLFLLSPQIRFHKKKQSV